MGTLATFHLPLTFGFVMFVAYAQAEVDCNKHLNYSSVKKCCMIPDPNYSAYTKQCPALENERALSPCGYHCIFNASYAFQGDQLNMPNVRKMMSTLLDNDTDLVDVFNVGFEKCVPLITKKLAEMKANNDQALELKPPGFPNCQLLAFQYLMCAHKHAFSSCPAESWTETPECEHAKEYVSKCSDERPPGFGRKRNGVQRFGGRARSKTQNHGDPVQQK